MTEKDWIIIWVLIAVIAIPIIVKLRVWTINRIVNDFKKTEQQEKQEFRKATKPLTQQSFEEWKAEKRKRDQGGFVDLDAPIRLPWRRTV